MLLDGRRALVTGVGDPRSIGFAAARCFIRHGARVAVADLDGEAVEAAAAALGPAALPFVADIALEAEVEAMMDGVRACLGGLDILVNNAGIARPGAITEIKPAEFDRLVAVNLRGTFLVSRAAARMMEHGGAIVSVASIAAQRGSGLMGGAHYAASKGGVISLTRAMARELGPRGIRANAVNPGVITTGLTIGFYDEDLTRHVLQGIPLGRFGTAEEVADACLFLASPLSAYVTGTALDVNGGMHMS